MNNVILGPGLQAIVRTWLDANHVLITGSDECVLIDTGCSATADRTLALLRDPAALGTRRLGRIVNTHCHSDHMGGNAAIARAYGAPITVPEEAAPLITAWNGRELLLDYADQQAERFTPDATIQGDSHVDLGGIVWQTIAAPGHDMTALVFYSPEHRVLVSGDALWERGFGIIEPLDRLDERLAAQRATLERMTALDIEVVVPGHGVPFRDAGAALDRSFQRLEAYKADPLKLARHCLKAFFMFALLGRGRIAQNELPDYFGHVECYREYNARFFKTTATKLAELITGELLNSGAIVQREGYVVPA